MALAYASEHAITIKMDFLITQQQKQVINHYLISHYINRLLDSCLWIVTITQ